MPRKAPEQSGYARIAQAEEEEEEGQAIYSDDDDPFHDGHILSTSQHGSYRSQHGGMHKTNGALTPRQASRRKRTNSGVDIKAINARLERWAEEIKDKFTIKRLGRGKSAAEEEQLEIYSSVFQAPDWIRPATKQTLDTGAYDGHDNGGDAAAERISKLEFDDIVESVRTAIELGKHPTLISQGSSGSYFARNSSGKVVGVFKPKDEEPYASKNPKWTKWIHRNLFPFAFGRACLIPNLSYVSEAAAYLLDVQLRTNLVPYTDVVSLSSKSFFYDYFDRRAFHQKGRALPEKPGSFQVFLKGYKGATEFFRDHPWPDHSTSYFRDVPRRKKSRTWTDNCRRDGVDAADAESPRRRSGAAEYDVSGDDEDVEFWSETLQQSFREQLEKLVILDYIMRNTDRGTDNWMIRIDTGRQRAEIIVKPPPQDIADGQQAVEYPRRAENMSLAQDISASTSTPFIGAIDNSLSWPWKHPDAWRSYPFGWLFLPVSLIGRPFSQRTRDHFLPLLTSKDWWIDTQSKLRRCFEIDADFKDKMFARQMAVMKGQAWNVVEALKTEDHGPLELTRRSRVCVWDDVVDIPVAVPLARPSEEMRRKAHTYRAKPGQNNYHSHEDEQDISTAHGDLPSAVSHDLLGLKSPAHQAGSNRFNHSRQDSTETVTQASQSNDPLSPAKESESSNGHLDTQRPGPKRSNTAANRKSLDLTRNQWPSPHAVRQRPFSFHAKRPGNLPVADDDEGDIGYAAAADQERSRRKVIVERLEMVKTRAPFFTWC